MNSDRELLELAAKAAAIFMTPADWPYSNPCTSDDFELTFNEEDSSITGPRIWYGEKGDLGGTESYTWAPLTDDGDALRLAVKLGLNIRIDTRAGFSWIKRFEGSVRHDGDPFAATRRAIVRAAAAIGKAMP